MTDRPYNLLLGDCLALLPTIPDCSIDAIVTDPPYEMGFMGRAWDRSGISFRPDVWRECLRVLKPGGHMLAFGGSRTYHRICCAIEDAGFEIRDCVMWLYGSGFPKSHDVSKAIDKEAGAERAVVGQRKKLQSFGANEVFGDGPDKGGIQLITSPATTDAERWQGWGTALKPAHEPIVVARKPLIGTVAQNVQAHGTGAINIDGCRVDPTGESKSRDGENAALKKYRGNVGGFAAHPSAWRGGNPTGRWPANVIHDGSVEVLAGFPVTGPSSVRPPTGRDDRGVPGFTMRRADTDPRGLTDSGGSAARFFYCAKASARDRDEGMDGHELKSAGNKNGSGRGYPETDPYREIKRKNTHPTVKPTDLMRYLCRLITPPGGLILDPFNGSGSTGKGALLEGFRYLGIEREQEFYDISLSRLAHAAESGPWQYVENPGTFADALMSIIMSGAA